jgi:dihydroorotase-like cyclic amidohydrolase
VKNQRIERIGADLASVHADQVIDAEGKLSPSRPNRRSGAFQ